MPLDSDSDMTFLEKAFLRIFNQIYQRVFKQIKDFDIN